METNRHKRCKKLYLARRSSGRRAVHINLLASGTYEKHDDSNPMKNRIPHSIMIPLVCFLVLMCGQIAQGITIRLTPAGRTVVVWAQDQTVSGTVSGSISSSGVLYVNGIPKSFVVLDTTFSVPIRIGDGSTTIVARVDSSGIPTYSDTLTLTLGYNVRPEIIAYATVAGPNVTLHAAILNNPDSSLLSFRWSPRGSNPGSVTLQGSLDSVASFTVVPGLPGGEYLFDLMAATSRGDTVRPVTLVTLDSAGSAYAFDVMKDHARWIDTAVIYTIDPHLFVENGTFGDIIKEIPELAALGINTIWLTPIFPTTEPNLGYHVLDYFKIRTDYGTEQDLHDLVSLAHAHGIRVMLDLVPNHTTIYHPYAQDAIAYGQRSHYYDFYDHAGASGPVSIGLMTFTIYFYPELVNLNFGNPEVDRMMMEAGRYWIEKFDIDGYRLDMVWAVDRRYPDYMRAWSLAMKQTKPTVFLLAETFADTSGDAFVSLVDERYDAAYDWQTLGHKSWEGIFRNGSPSSATGLRYSIAEHAVPGGKVLRILETNDGSRFLYDHTMSQLQTAAPLLFTIHGVPMMYMAQEIGSTVDPWSGIAVLERGVSIHEQDRLGLWPYYHALINLRKQNPMFFSDNYQELDSSPATTFFAYHRWEGQHHAFCALNLSDHSGSATVTIPVDSLHLDASRTYYLTDVISGEVFPTKSADLSSLVLNYTPWSAQVLLLDTIAVVTSIPTVLQGRDVPVSIALLQNYPNPFNPTTAIEYLLPSRMRVSLKVLDVLGRVVATLVEGECAPGWHSVSFDGSGRASGLYFSVLRAGGKAEIKKMLLLK
jgi:cyclomaltodextrinase / maltogenic alpha-amylase / neopullulanase